MQSISEAEAELNLLSISEAEAELYLLSISWAEAGIDLQNFRISFKV